MSTDWYRAPRKSCARERSPDYGFLRTEYRLFDLTGQWQMFSMETVKTGLPAERAAVRFEVRSAGNAADLDDVYATRLSAGKH